MEQDAHNATLLLSSFPNIPSAALENTLRALQTNTQLRRFLSLCEEYWSSLKQALTGTADELSSNASDEKINATDPSTPNWPQLATLLARLVRNSVAGVPENQERVRSMELYVPLEQMLFIATDRRHNLLEPIGRAAGQALSNALTANSSLQTFFWQRYMNTVDETRDVLHCLLSARDAGTVTSGLVLVHNCICENKERAAQLVSTKQNLVTLLLDRADELHKDEARDDFELVYKIFERLFHFGLFVEIYERIGRGNHGHETVTDAHLALFRFLDSSFSQMVHPNTCQPPDAIRLLTKVTTSLAGKAASGMREFCGMAENTTNSAKETQIGKETPDVTATQQERKLPSEILPEAKLIDLVERDATKHAALVLLLKCLGVASMDANEEVVRAMIEENIVPSAIDLLAHAHATLPRATKAASALNLGEPDQAFRSMGGLRGLKCDLVRLIGNLSAGRTDVQDEIRRLGGLGLVLEMCNVDDNNPYIREHALFAIRNLLANNAENQSLVEGLRPIEAVQHPALSEMGLETKLDEEGGNVKLVAAASTKSR